MTGINWDEVDADTWSECTSEGETEVLVTKGSGDFAQLVGYMDAIRTVHVDIHVDHMGRIVRDFVFAFEVKTGKPDIGSALRQIKLYRQFYPIKVDSWVLVAGYDSVRAYMDDHEQKRECIETVAPDGGSDFEFRDTGHSTWSDFTRVALASGVHLWMVCADECRP
jgi:hypothetical protein